MHKNLNARRRAAAAGNLSPVERLLHNLSRDHGYLIEDRPDIIAQPIAHTTLWHERWLKDERDLFHSTVYEDTMQ